MYYRSDLVDKYMPKRIDECVLRQPIMNRVLSMIKFQRLQNYLISGPTGSGKSSLAQVIIDELNLESLLLRVSSLKEVRKTLNPFVTHHSLTNAKKIVIVDEFHLSTEAVKKEILISLEDSIASFILICNDSSKLSPAIISRMAEINFNIPDDEKEYMLKKYFERAKFILKSESISFSDQVLMNYVELFYPMFRKSINEIQNGIHENNQLMPHVK